MGAGSPDSAARRLSDDEVHAALLVCAQDPVGSVLAATRLTLALTSGIAGSGGQVWGYPAVGPLEAVCWVGANVVPVLPPGMPARRREAALDAFAELASRDGRRSSSIVGRAAPTLGLWRRLEARWGRAREVRDDQPSLVIDHQPHVEPDPAVRLARPDEMPDLLPACVRMFVEEVGYSPVSPTSSAYEQRVLGLVRDGRSFVRRDAVRAGRPGPVVFKAEVGALVPAVAQVQGVWVEPARRGQGLSAPGVAAVVAGTLERRAPLVSLYVNAYNTRALATYRAVGFEQEGTYATVLF